ncbi:metal-binding protein [Natronorubrum sp. JWXQ-INN-674]|uniref:Metal-binding protein n=2 Tax=Natronorubrum halalkaliphilum TaxID=2691917 RepID=A0A6B0VH17_9EURY|nr:metal-binding protein [Natronorubrum halalkaliphilum]
MRSQEYVQLHALLYRLRHHLECEDSARSFAAYDAQPVRPTHVHRSKEAHGRAIELLLEGFVETIERQSRESTAPIA